MLLKLYNNLFESVCICRRRRVPVLHFKVSIVSPQLGRGEGRGFLSSVHNWGEAREEDSYRQSTTGERRGRRIAIVSPQLGRGEGGDTIFRRKIMAIETSLKHEMRTGIATWTGRDNRKLFTLLVNVFF